MKIQSDIAKKEQQIKLLSTQNQLQKAVAEKDEQQKKVIYGVVALVLLLGGSIVYRYVRMKKLQSQREVLSERLRISKELHDEVGSTLSGIAMYSSLTKQLIATEKKEEVERSLTSMQQSAGEMVNKLSDIVWLVNPDKDSLEKLVERLEEYLEKMARLKNMEAKISIIEKLNSYKLRVRDRRNIYLIFKEAINNAVKYSDATLLKLNIQEIDNKKLEFSLYDNGKGFDETTVKKGNGLINMQQRAEDASAIFSLNTKPGNGTTISLTFKIT
jgi:signal transduction histidine kinase